MALGELPVLAATAAATSPLHRRVVFLVGSAETRAGLLETALLTVDGVTGLGAPSRLFADGVGGLLANFALGAEPGRPGPGPVGGTGVSVLAGPQQVLAAIREFADGVLGAAGPGVVVEYSPDHARVPEALVAVYPDAVLVVVDGPAVEGAARSVTVSSGQISSSVDAVVAEVLAAVNAPDVS